MDDRTATRLIMLATAEQFPDPWYAERELEAARKKRGGSEPPCKYACKGPILAIWRGKTIEVVQSDCGMWDCPRCGPKLARRWYGRLVHGAVTLAAMGRELSFVTLTCRGSDISVKQAELEYYRNTNRVLSLLRARAKAKGDRLEYVQVTERQKRRHPHSHFIAAGVYLNAPTCLRVDCSGGQERYHTSGRGKGECGFNSDLSEMAVRAGLGPQARITPVHSPEAASKYVAKYLFKASMFTEEWPKKWKRIRVSSQWPEREYEKPRIDVILKPADCDVLNGYHSLTIDGGQTVRSETTPAMVSCPDDILRTMIDHRLEPGERFKPAFAIDPETGKTMFIAYLDHDSNEL